MAPRFGGAPTCPRCTKAVYMAEQIIGPGGAWHRNCLTCIECGKRLDSTSLTERDQEAYCRVCYNRKWGPKGYGFAGGAAFLSTEDKLPKEILANSDFAQRQKELEQERQQELDLQRQREHEMQHQRELDLQRQQRENASQRQRVEQKQMVVDTKPLSPALPPRKPAIASPDTPPVPTTTRPVPAPPSNLNSFWSNRQQPSYISHQTSYVPKKFNLPQNDTCTKCGKAVYAAELALGAGNKYHKHCLRCTHCDKSLNSSNMQDKDFDLYCRGCYSKLFGPKGYGYGNLLSPEGTTR
ncbi:hypothetical protein DM01DRAFT_1301787 [Hesseltinella vesiculosa]|uniref:LIM zinc-binding domain-containing protein n=1 Tax=Hesseltinella vesiculosa TaxID=101127 RepID=A0A1X2GQH5_9FUNG|nr:hypothetical protein DM01DRAFT_1301787 [Hesseltinella vesiculosa]